MLTLRRLFSELPNPSVVSINRSSSGWYLNYTITRTLDQRNVLSMTFDLPSENVAVVLRRAFRTKRPKEFSFPVGFSVDLRQIAVLGCVIRLIPPDFCSDEAAYTFHSQNMIEVSEEHAEDGEIYFFSKHFKNANSTKYGAQREDWFRTSFSPDRKYLLAIRGSMAPGSYESFYHEWQLTIHQDHSLPDEQPKYQFLTQHSTKVTGSIDGNFAFHPFEPVGAISRLGNVVLWFFAAQRK